jgi:hypothetical protein
MISSSLDVPVLNNTNRLANALALDDSPAHSRKDFLATLLNRFRVLSALGVARRDPLVARARTVEALRELASHYEATQPSYAADLLAAAADETDEDDEYAATELAV